MSAEQSFEVEIVIGEDFAAQIFWTDEDGTAVPLAAAARMDVRDMDSALVLQFDSGNDAATKAAIAVTGSQGLLQLTCPKSVTRALPPGRYLCDLFATASAGVAPFPTSQQQRLFSGWALFSQRVTIMEASPA